MIRELVESVSGYPGLFAFCAISGLVVPLPEDFSLLYAGARIGNGDWAWAPTLIVALLGVMTRDVFAWGIGRYFGGWLLETVWADRLIGARRLQRARRLVEVHGSAAVLFGRFLIGFRAPVFMVSGAMGIDLRRFVLWDVLGLLIAVPGMIGLGYAFGAPMSDLVFWILQRTRLVVVGTALVGGLWLWWRLRERSSDARSSDARSSEGDPPEVPPTG